MAVMARAQKNAPESKLRRTPVRASLCIFNPFYIAAITEDTHFEAFGRSCRWLFQTISREIEVGLRSPNCPKCDHAESDRHVPTIARAISVRLITMYL